MAKVEARQRKRLKVEVMFWDGQWPCIARVGALVTVVFVPENQDLDPVTVGWHGMTARVMASELE